MPFRLYVPLNESELILVAQEAAKHIHIQYTLLGVDEPVTVENKKTWYWSSGQKITSPWCPGQQNHNAETILIVTQTSPHCIHDDGITPARPFICQEGNFIYYCSFNLVIRFYGFAYLIENVQ